MNTVSTKFVSQVDTSIEDPTVYKYSDITISNRIVHGIKVLYHPLCHKLLQNIYFIIGHSILREKYTKKNILVQTRNVLKESNPTSAQTQKVQMSQKAI